MKAQAMQHFLPLFLGLNNRRARSRRKEGRPFRDGLPKAAYIARPCQLGGPYRASGWTRTAMAAIWARVAVSDGATVVSLVPLT